MLREALIIVVVAGAATGLLVAIRGVPDLVRPSTEEASCSGPLPERPAVQWVSADEAVHLLGRPDAAFVDTRDRAEYEAGHIAGALHAPMDRGTIDTHLLELLHGVRTVVAYCDTASQCARSTRFAGLLSAAGFGDVRVLEGGISTWLQGGRPAESGECRQCR